MPHLVLTLYLTTLYWGRRPDRVSCQDGRKTPNLALTFGIQAPNRGSFDTTIGQGNLVFLEHRKSPVSDQPALICRLISPGTDATRKHDVSHANRHRRRLTTSRFFGPSPQLNPLSVARSLAQPCHQIKSRSRDF